MKKLSFFIYIYWRNVEKLADRQTGNRKYVRWNMKCEWNMKFRNWDQNVQMCVPKNFGNTTCARRRFVVPNLPMTAGEQLFKYFIQIWRTLNGKQPQRWRKYLNRGTIAQAENKAFILNHTSYSLQLRKFTICLLWGCITHYFFFEILTFFKHIVSLLS